MQEQRVNEDNSSLEILLEERAILNLLARFDDASNRQDESAFRALWTPDAVWEIGKPLPKANGIDNIVAECRRLLELNTFFFRLTGQPIILWVAKQVTVRSPTVELGHRHNGAGYRNVAMYEDTLVRQQGHWYFAHRNYHYIWLDRTSPLPGESVTFP